jgi:hypothetical protein
MTMCYRRPAGTATLFARGNGLNEIHWWQGASLRLALWQERGWNGSQVMADQHEQDTALSALAAEFQKTMAHAWMVRTFIKHCDEIDDFPELMGIVRAVFDMSRAIENKVGDPDTYFRFAAKKIGKLRKAVIQFREDAWRASTHTNFQQALVSIEHATDRMESILHQVSNKTR